MCLVQNYLLYFTIRVGTALLHNSCYNLQSNDAYCNTLYSGTVMPIVSEK